MGCKRDARLAPPLRPAPGCLPRFASHVLRHPRRCPAPLGSPGHRPSASLLGRTHRDDCARDGAARISCRPRVYARIFRGPPTWWKSPALHEGRSARGLVRGRADCWRMATPRLAPARSPFSGCDAPPLRRRASRGREQALAAGVLTAAVNSADGVRPPPQGNRPRPAKPTSRVRARGKTGCPRLPRKSPRRSPRRKR